MAVKVALDTNIIAYAEGIADPARQARALEILSHIPREMFLISIQVVGELFNVLTKRKVPRPRAKERVLYWTQALAVVDTTQDLMAASVDLAAEHHLRVWDAVVLVAAAEAQCELLLSEDFQNGFAWRGVTVVNPFSPKPHPVLNAFLKSVAR
jgi:predicted nucleic acid-binding protein